MRSDRGFVSGGDKNKMLKTSRRSFFNRPLNQRPVNDWQHFFWGDFCCW
jgi:hypothetical protein